MIRSPAQFQGSPLRFFAIENDVQVPARGAIGEETRQVRFMQCKYSGNNFASRRGAHLRGNTSFRLLRILRGGRVRPFRVNLRN